MTTLITAVKETNCNQEFLVKNVIRSSLLNLDTFNLDGTKCPHYRGVHIITGRNCSMSFGVFGTKRTVYYKEVSSRRGSTAPPAYINSSPRWMLFQLIVTYESLSGRDCSCQRPRACPKTPNKRCQIISTCCQLKKLCYNYLSKFNGGNCRQTE